LFLHRKASTSKLEDFDPRYWAKASFYLLPGSDHCTRLSSHGSRVGGRLNDPGAAHVEAAAETALEAAEENSPSLASWYTCIEARPDEQPCPTVLQEATVPYIWCGSISSKVKFTQCITFFCKLCMLYRKDGKSFTGDEVPQNEAVNSISASQSDR
jgi:hypothetical protein